MPWPTPQDYNEAIQNPRQNLADPELAAGTPELTKLGLPRPITGNFASVYRMRCGGRDWAVRCFWREFADMQERYAAISVHLRKAGLPYTVGFDYLSRGIKIRGTWYPLLKMEWVQGELLNDFVAGHRDDAGQMRRLSQRWLTMMQALEAAGIAHGDLQHGNVLVVGNDFRLVDYDAMYVPALAGRGSHELGHQHYQHPARAAADYGPWLDRFSGWLIYASITGVAARPDLWDTLQAGDESMLFRRSDLLNPGSSPAFSQLAALAEPQVQEAAYTLKRSLSSPPYRVPPVGGAPRVPAAAGRKGRRSSTVPPAPSTAPDWVRDHITGAVEPRVQRNPGILRLSLAVSVAAVCASALLAADAGVVHIVPLLLAPVSAAWNAALMWACFSREPAVAARAEIARRRRRQARRVRRAERNVALVERRREREAARRDKRIDFIERRKRLLEEHEGRDHALASSWRLEWSSVYEESRRVLSDAEREERKEALDGQRQRHVNGQLRRCTLRRADLPGVGWFARGRLWAKGVHTAADVTEDRMRTIRDLEPPIVAAVVAWRVESDLAARRTAPRSLDAGLEQVVRARYARAAARLDARHGVREARLDRIDATIGDFWAVRRSRWDATTARVHDAFHGADRQLVADLSEVVADRVAERVALGNIEAELAAANGLSFVGYVWHVIAPRASA